MNKVTKEQYEFALARVEELLPLVDDNTPSMIRMRWSLQLCPIL